MMNGSFGIDCGISFSRGAAPPRCYTAPFKAWLGGIDVISNEDTPFLIELVSIIFGNIIISAVISSVHSSCAKLPVTGVHALTLPSKAL